MSDREGTLTSLEYEELADFRQALRRFLRFSEEAASTAGLTPQKYQAMLVIRGSHRGERVTVGRLAASLQIRHHSAVGLVDRLVAGGMVQRGASTDDRRQVFVDLTPKGSELLDRLAPVHRDELRRLGPELMQTLQSILTARGKKK